MRFSDLHAVIGPDTGPTNRQPMVAYMPKTWLTSNTGPDSSLSQELAQLRQEREEQTRQLRKAAFMTLLRERREAILQYFRCIADCAAINAISAPPSPRELELDPWAGTSNAKIPYFHCYDLPDSLHVDLSLEDMERAHADACLEEILNETVKSIKPTDVGNC